MAYTRHFILLPVERTLWRYSLETCIYADAGGG
jgi:hypothetical protein